jgi:hypothetical protein
MVATVKMVTTRELDEARAKAEKLCVAAFAAQEIAQPDGGTLALCLEGRLTRAFILAGEAQNRGDAARVAQIKAGIEQLGEQTRQAQGAAHKAASDYAGLCAVAGREPVEVYPPKCECAGCKRKAAQEAYLAADATLRRAVFALLTPADATGALPALVGFVEGADDEKTRGRLWNALKRISDAQRAYRAACEAFGREPDWVRMLCIYD